ncbi:Transcription factor 25 [Globomyces sp. JEL0801]|nr:Transcription factor 25 [Globomyces sp. JEL0801]
MDDDLVLDESSSDHNANLNIPITSSNKKSKKKSKKKKPKSAQPVTEKDEPIQNGSEEDEIDKAIREVNEKLGDLPKSIDMGSTERTVKEKSIFLIEYKHLDGDAEMKKQFGSIALRETRTGRKVKSTRRRALANPKSHWPRANPTGLSCELLSTHEGYSTFSFKHSKDYEVTQLQFIQAIETLNPNNIMEVLAKSPFHIDSNLQMSEILKQNGDITMASDFVERCLYAFEASLHPNFSLSAGNCRLEFNRIENSIWVEEDAGGLVNKGLWHFEAFDRHERRNGTNPAFFDNALNIVTLEYQNKSQMPLSIQRTIVLSDNSTFGNRLPAGTMDSLLSFDPLPPPTAIDNPYTTRLTTQRESAENAGIIDRLMGFLFRPDGAPQNIHVENDFLEENDEDEGLDEDF